MWHAFLLSVSLSLSLPPPTPPPPALPHRCAFLQGNHAHANSVLSAQTLFRLLCQTVLYIKEIDPPDSFQQILGEVQAAEL